MYALKRWQKNPTHDNREAVAGSLREYCNRIAIRYVDQHLDRLVATYTRRKSFDIVNLVKSGAIVATSASTGLASVGLFVNVSDFVYATYQYVSRRRLRSRLRLQTQPIDVDLGVPHVVQQMMT